MFETADGFTVPETVELAVSTTAASPSTCTLDEVEAGCKVMSTVATCPTPRVTVFSASANPGDS